MICTHSNVITHCDVTMDVPSNVIAHCYCNDVARDAHCDVIMNDHCDVILIDLHWPD